MLMNKKSSFRQTALIICIGIIGVLVFGYWVFLFQVERQGELEAIVILILFIMTSVTLIWQHKKNSHYKTLEQAQTALRRIEWMLSPKNRRSIGMKRVDTQPNSKREKAIKYSLIQNSVGEEVLHDISNDYLDLLETSVSIYEKDGESAYVATASTWCQLFDCASPKLCESGDGSIFHEISCKSVAEVAVSTEAPVNRLCSGCIHIYSVPIWAHSEVVGAISISYGDPPQEPEILKQLANKFAVNIEQLRKNARDYESRPTFITEVAKERLHGSARLIGSMIEHMAQLEAANRELESFAYSVSHDLRTPLRAINGFSRIIMEDYADKLDEEGNRLLNVVRTNSQKMDHLITDLLTLSRVTRADVRHTSIDMTTLAQSVLQEVAISERTNLDFSVEALPTVLGDPVLMRQVWFNLLENALKYTRPKD
ncbi:MAG: hypothetical protein NUK65_10890, partial [Firmicutes bacterium]|nr:hypothetical protein [Bacillota bacterium]